MKTSKNNFRTFGAILTLVVLMSWNTLPIYSCPRTAQARSNASLTTVNSEQAPSAIANGKIAFASSTGDHTVIETMNPDGSDRTALTTGPHDVAPAWSLDGTQIAFVRTHGEVEGETHQSSEIFVMSADGTNQRGLTPPGESNYFPAWSPDGTRLLFLRGTLRDGARQSQVFTMNADGSNQTPLTDSAERIEAPTWSPDGSKVAFLRAGSLAVINADGSDQRVIGRPYSPVAWSPNSSQLAFASLDDPGIFVINVDGTNLTKITEPRWDDTFEFTYDSDPSWSPDGSMITFSRFGGCNMEFVYCSSDQIWVVNTDGSNARMIINNGALYPVWSPDGTQIVFYRGIGGDLFITDADGQGITNITNTSDQGEFAPSWQRLVLAGCAESVSPAERSFEAAGGTGSIDVVATNECSWKATSYAGWVSIMTAESSGTGSIVFSVEANTRTGSRKTGLIVAGRIVTVTQAGAPVTIISAFVSGKRLFVTGENFDSGAIILLNGREQKTIHNNQTPTTGLIGLKAGKIITTGDKLQVRNPNGTVSQEFAFVAP